MIDQATLEQWTELAKRDDWHMTFVGSDIRIMLGEITRLRSELSALRAPADDAELVGDCGGEGVAELKDRVIASANVSKKRAEVIARTEVNSAMNNGAYEQMKALDIPTIKEWIATDDSRTRESHAEVDGDPSWSTCRLTP